jgi:hypothetical protein
MKRLAVVLLALAMTGIAYPHGGERHFDNLYYRWNRGIDLHPQRICLEPGESRLVRVFWSRDSWRQLQLVDGDGPSGFWASQRSITLPNQISSRDDYIKVAAKDNAEFGQYYFVYERPSRENDDIVVLYVRVGNCFPNWRNY